MKFRIIERAGKFRILKRSILGWADDNDGYYGYDFKSLEEAEKQIQEIRDLKKPWKLIKEIEIK